MATSTIRQDQPVETQPRLERRDQFGPVLSARDCMQLIPCRSLNATYEWLKRHGIPRGRGHIRVYRHDLERELARIARKPRRQVSANSLANLRKRSA